MSTTLKDIAKKTGFSVSTISRVLHDNSKKYKISVETQTKVQQTANDLGYRLNTLARGLRMQKTYEIGLIVPDIANPFFSAVCKNLAGELRKGGYNFIVYDTDKDISIERSAIKKVLEKRVDGLIIASVGQEFSHIQKIRDANIPLVMIDRCSDSVDVDSVSVDNVKGSMFAMNYLIKEGHTRIAFIQGMPGSYANETRLQGYKLALHDTGIAVDKHLIVGNDFRAMNGYLETKHLLKLANPPTAIFTAGNIIALGALDACKKAGVRVPQDISLVTFDDPVFTPYLSPPLTAVEQPIKKLSEMAVAILYRRMKNLHGMRKTLLLEPKLNIRSSVARISTRKNIIHSTKIEKN